MRQFPIEMINNAGRDIQQYERYKKVLGDSIGSLAEFGRIKYNNSEKWKSLQKKKNTYVEINQKLWTDDFKQKSKEAYDRFSEEGFYLSVHALSRLPRLNKKGFYKINEQNVKEILNGNPNYKDGENKLVCFSEQLQLSVIKNSKTGDIVTIVRAKKPKGDWENV